MEKVQLSDGGLLVSPIIYSFWRWKEEADDLSLSTLEKKINTCLDLGINTFDHADTYGNYQIERFFGKAIQKKSFNREDIVISTKCGLNLQDKNRPEHRVTHYDSSYNNIIKSVDHSLKNFQTDYIDLLLLDNFDPLMNPEETASALTEVVSNGKVNHIGVANFTVHQHQLLALHLGLQIVTNHVELNLLNLKPVVDGTIDFLKQQYTRPLAWAPLAGGRLVDESDIASFNVRTALKRIAEKYNINIEQLAIAWLIKLGALPVVGTNSIQRIKNATSAVGIEIDRQDWFEIYFSAIKNH